MAEYIEREAVIKWALRCADGYYHIETPTENAICDINAIPAADVKPVAKGEWIKGWHVVECSACSEKFNFGDEVYVEDYDIIADIGWHYCPNCGADMRGDNNVEV